MVPEDVRHPDMFDDINQEIEVEFQKHLKRLNIEGTIDERQNKSTESK